MNLLKRVRAAFWFVNVSPWWTWKVHAIHGPRIMIFRNRRYPRGAKNHLGQDIGGKRMYVRYRWGFAILGLEIGDRGGTREDVRRRLGLTA